MRKLILLVLALLLTGCAGTKFYFFGLDTDNFKKMSGGDWFKFTAGAASVFAVHLSGHYMASLIEDNDIHQDGIYELYERDTWLANNGGFLMEHGFGLLLTSFEGSRHWQFTRGYVATSAVHTWTYPLLPKRESDFEYQGEGHWEMYGIYSSVALHNLLRVNWGADETNIVDTGGASGTSRTSK